MLKFIQPPPLSCRPALLQPPLYHQESHVLRALPERTFSALALLCIMYAGFKRIEPGMDIGVDLGEEWGMAERVRGRSGG